MSTTTPPASDALPGDTDVTVAYPAGLGRRLGALLYDSLLILALWMMTLFLLVVARDGATVTGWWVQVLLASEVLAFYVFCWRRGGQTLGMTAWRIKLLDCNGNPCSWSQLGRRVLLAPLSLACLGLGYIWMLIDNNQATWHDRFSDTRVVHLPKEGT